MKQRFDVLGLGSVAVDDLIYVPEYPPADAKLAVLDTARQCGGLTATALVAAARLGARCAYAGILGRDDLSRFALAALRRERINLTHLVYRRNAQPVHSFIIVDRRHQTRNVFFDTRRAFGAHPARPPLRIIRSTRVLLVDHFGIAGMIRAATCARAAGIPVVGDFERAGDASLENLLKLVDHLIVSEAFAQEVTRTSDPATAALALARDDRGTVIVTGGRKGCWFVSPESGGKARHRPAFRVESVDTTGCGDVFHGAYAAALAQGQDLEFRIRFAAAAAALKSMRPGGQRGIPNAREVRRFLRNLPSESFT